MLTLALSISFSFTACSVTKHPPTQGNPSQFTISPNEISTNQAFTITIPDLHPSSMSIRDPKGTWHVIHNSGENIFILPQEEYVKARKIEISPSELTGITWIEGKKVEGLVFSLPGEYLIYMADNLETEPENTFHFMGTVFLK